MRPDLRARDGLAASCWAAVEDVLCAPSGGERGCYARLEIAP
ncbi:MAG TPA: hypothetical protein VF631_08870 [Allosphingosinicella sp.]